MERSVIVHSVFFSIVIGISCTGILLDKIFEVPKTNIDLICRDGPCEMRISGVRLSSSKLTLDYNKCVGDNAKVAISALYSDQGVSYRQLSEGQSRDSSIVEFAHLNIHEEGTEIIGDIGLTEQRAQTARKLSVFGVILQGISFFLFIITRSEPVSVISKAPDGGGYLFRLRQLQNWLTLTSAGILWLSIVVYSTVIPTILAHAFHEARDRCAIEFRYSEAEHYEMRTLGGFVRDHGNPTGASIILLSSAVSLLLLHAIYLFILANGRKPTRLQLTPSQGRSLPWYCKVWPWKLTLGIAVFSVFVSFWVMNLTKTRGYLINNFYWTYGSKVAQKTGLSRTGTLLDFAQKVLNLIAVPENVMAATTYMWLVIIPVVAVASFAPASALLKGLQDFSILLIIRATIAWVTIAPTTLSMLEKPECFEQPDPSRTLWAWLVVFDVRQSCNDSMFSITVAVVGMQALALIFYGMFSRVIDGWYALLVYGLISFGAFGACIIAVVSRHQYSSDIVIGICIVIVYMLTQIPAYKLLFGGDAINILHPSKLLTESVIPTLEDCANRVKSYSQASKELRGLKSSTNEFQEMALMYRSVGRAIQKAKALRLPSVQNGAMATNNIE
jgi:hypothetical protein